MIIISWADAAESSKDRFEVILFYIYYFGAALDTTSCKVSNLLLSGQQNIQSRTCCIGHKNVFVKLLTDCMDLLELWEVYSHNSTLPTLHKKMKFILSVIDE
jgi:hypothetical protein